MATRENQGLQIGLIVCVIVIVFLGVFWILTWKKLGEMSTVVAEADQRAKVAQDGTREANGHLTTLKGYVGYPQEASLDEITNQYLIDMTKFADNWPTEKRNYRELSGYLIAEVMDRSRRVTDEVARVNQMSSERDQARKQEQDSSNQFQMDYAKTSKDFSDEKQKFEEDRQDLNVAKDQLATELTVAKQEKAKVESELNAKIAVIEEEISDVTLANSLLEEKVARIEWQDPGQPDGRITWVDHRGGQLYLDVGSADGLRARTTFTVFDDEETTIEPTRKKGTVEILRIIGPHRSLAKITDKDVSKLMLPNDVVYSSAWDRGRRLRFALAPGLMDIDDDGENDRQKIRDIIAMNGGIIDFDVDEEGHSTGKLSINTRYLVIGKLPSETNRKNSDDEEHDNRVQKEQEQMAKVIQQSTELYEQAQRFSVERISVEKFIELLGWQETDKIVRLGPVSRFDDYTAVDKNDVLETDADAVNATFRERQP